MARQFVASMVEGGKTTSQTVYRLEQLERLGLVDAYYYLGNSCRRKNQAESD